jgi:hypothetical protein
MQIARGTATFLYKVTTHSGDPAADDLADLSLGSIEPEHAV